MRFLSPLPSLIIWNKGEGTTLNWQPTRCPELDILTPCVLSPTPWNGYEHPILHDGVWTQRCGGTREWWSQSLKSCDLFHDANESVGQESQLPLPLRSSCWSLPGGVSICLQEPVGAAEQWLRNETLVVLEQSWVPWRVHRKSRICLGGIHPAQHERRLNNIQSDVTLLFLDCKSITKINCWVWVA